MPRHNQLLINHVSGRIDVGERVVGQAGYGSGIIEELSADRLSEKTGRRLLKELMKLYPLDALSEA